MKKNCMEGRVTMYGPNDLVRVRDGISAGMAMARIAENDGPENDEPIELSVPGFSVNDYSQEGAE